MRLQPVLMKAPGEASLPSSVIALPVQPESGGHIRRPLETEGGIGAEGRTTLNEPFEVLGGKVRTTSQFGLAHFPLLEDIQQGFSRGYCVVG